MHGLAPIHWPSATAPWPHAASPGQAVAKPKPSELGCQIPIVAADAAGAHKLPATQAEDPCISASARLRGFVQLVAMCPRPPHLKHVFK